MGGRRVAHPYARAMGGRRKVAHLYARLVLDAARLGRHFPPEGKGRGHLCPFSGMGPLLRFIERGDEGLLELGLG